MPKMPHFHFGRRRGHFVRSEDRDRDILEMLLADRFGQKVAKVLTDTPIAIRSDDHKFPLGTRNDNSRHPRFVNSCEILFGRAIRHLDLGCAGGGLVWNFCGPATFLWGLRGVIFRCVNAGQNGEPFHTIFSPPISQSHSR